MKGGINLCWNVRETDNTTKTRKGAKHKDRRLTLACDTPGI